MSTRALVPKQPLAETGGKGDGAKLPAQNCVSCHTLAAAHATGTVGPDLDQLEPTRGVVVRQVTNGGGGLPAFGGRLIKPEIAAIANYVATAAGKK